MRCKAAPLFCKCDFKGMVWIIQASLGAFSPFFNLLESRVEKKPGAMAGLLDSVYYSAAWMCGSISATEGPASGELAGKAFPPPDLARSARIRSSRCDAT